MMNKLEITLTLIMSASLIANIGLVIYLRSALVRLLTFSEEMHDLKDMVDNFSNHIDSVYEMEMFYGDETLQFLMDHARDLKEQLLNFEYIYTLIEKEKEEGNERETENPDTEETEEKSQE